MSHAAEDFIPLAIAVLTVSDTRSRETDSSGQKLQDLLEQDGHRCAARELVIDDCYLIRAVVSRWIAEPEIDAVLITGGTGFSGRDSTPESVEPLLDKKIDGFGELFRQVSYQEIGSSTIQSRCLGGLANQTLIFCLPGSTGACTTAWEKILREQLDSRFRPCNFVPQTRAWKLAGKAGG